MKEKLEHETGEHSGASHCSADLLRNEADRITKIREASGYENDPMAQIAWAMRMSAAWLDSLQAPERQTRYVKMQEEHQCEYESDGGGCKTCGKTAAESLLPNIGIDKTNPTGT
jgi:hypothetical protein